MFYTGRLDLFQCFVFYQPIKYQWKRSKSFESSHQQQQRQAKADREALERQQKELVRTEDLLMLKNRLDIGIKFQCHQNLQKGFQTNYRIVNSNYHIRKYLMRVRLGLIRNLIPTMIVHSMSKHSGKPMLSNWNL